MALQVADGSVVVMKSEPMKAGDSEEGKTRMSGYIALPNLFWNQKFHDRGEGTCFVNIVNGSEWET